MSKNLKTLICCILSLLFVAGTIVCVMADSNNLFAIEAESVTAEDNTAEDTTADDVVETTTVVVDEPTSDEPTSVEPTTVEPTTKDDEVDESTTVEPSTEPAPTYKLGDVNFDGKITAADARLTLRFSAKLQAPTDVEAFVADVIVNKMITAADARLILRVSAQLDAESVFGKEAVSENTSEYCEVA